MAKNRDRADDKGDGKPDQGKSRAQKARDAAGAKLVDGEVYVHPTPLGDVRIARVTYHADADGQEWVEVHTAGDNEAGDPHFRIVNPPTLAEDPAGDIEIGGRRFREDPLAALAETLAAFGGAARAAGRRR